MKKQESYLYACPFCGNPPVITPWHGGPKSKRMISCIQERCAVNPNVCGRDARIASERWNKRSTVRGTFKVLTTEA